MATLDTLRTKLENANHAIIDSITGMVKRNVQTIRIARNAFILGYVNDEIIQEILNRQRYDGGWDDVEETLWAEGVLRLAGERSNDEIKKASLWIRTQRSENGGWGRTQRERPRIITTSLVLVLNPIIAVEDDYIWLESAWIRDYLSDIRLSYKGALSLAAFQSVNRKPSDSRLLQDTVEYLQLEQNNDGGFGPWKSHPIGSDPWSTGICLVGLCSCPQIVDERVICRAVDWLCMTQLPSGLWPYHFIDEGSVYAYWGLKEALNFLEKS